VSIKTYFKGDNESYSKKRISRRAKRISKTADIKESVIQRSAEDLLKKLNLRYIRIPDAVYNIIFSKNSLIPEWVKILIAAAISGLPDLTVLLKDGRYICIELKTKTGKLRQKQKEFRNDVGVNNFYTCRSIDEVIDVFRSYGLIIEKGV
jgi:hypothetical protein